MKAIIIIISCIALALALKTIDIVTSKKRINSVGAKSNDNSKYIAHIDVNDPVSVQEGLAHYKDLDD